MELILNIKEVVNAPLGPIKRKDLIYYLQRLDFQGLFRRESSVMIKEKLL